MRKRMNNTKHANKVAVSGNSLSRIVQLSYRRLVEWAAKTATLVEHRKYHDDDCQNDCDSKRCCATENHRGRRGSAQKSTCKNPDARQHGKKHGQSKSSPRQKFRKHSSQSLLNDQLFARVAQREKQVRVVDLFHRLETTHERACSAEYLGCSDTCHSNIQ